MTEVPNDAFSGLDDALVVEIKALMGRRGVRSSRALADLIGESSQYVSMRLDGGNPRTKKRTPLNTTDLAKIAYALGVTPDDLFHRGVAALKDGDIEGEQTEQHDA